jgi:hypothetical protein
MRISPLRLINSVCCVLSWICLPMSSQAANYTCTQTVGSGNNWNGNYWQLNGAGALTGPPSAGNLYVMTNNGTGIGNGLNNTRMRNPAATGVQTFGGDSLTMYTNSEMRAKTSGTILNFPGVNGNPGLILSGGLLDMGDDGTATVAGSVQLATPSYISNGNNGGGGGVTANNRNFIISAFLSGSGSMTLINCNQGVAQQVTGTSNTFSGQWIVQCGWLLGASDSSLGTNNITVDPSYTGYLATMPSASSPNGPAFIEVGYDIDSAGTLILTNGGQFKLHQSCYFVKVLIEGTPLTAGLHTYAELNANYPNNFPAGGSGSITVQPFNPVIIATQPVSQMLYSGETAHFITVAKGSQLTYQWYKNGTPLSNGLTGTGSTIGGATSTNLTISNISTADNGTYYAVATSPGYSPIQSQSATLAAVSPNGEAYEAAILAASPKPVAFYQFTEATDPSTSPYLFDYIGGYVGTYGAGVQNGFNGIMGPGAAAGFPGFAAGNKAAQFANGTGTSRASVPAWNLNTNTVTLTAWINPSATQLGNEGIVFCRAGTTVAGLNYSGATDANLNYTLGYTWANDYYTYSWDSRLVPPPGQWSFVALVVSSSNAVIHLMNTNGLVSATNVYTHPVQNFDGTTLIGDDNNDGGNGTRVFNGTIDDVAVFNAALSKAQLSALFSAGSGVANYAPFIAAQPLSTNLYAGQTARIAVAAGGTDPVTYRWYRGVANSGIATTPLSDGGRVSGTAGSTLVISNLVLADSADFLVVVANAFGSVTSLVATLTVQATSPSESITMSAQEPAGSDWDSATYWSDGNPASVSAVEFPGSTYELLPGSRLRTPSVVPNTTFPGVPLTVDGDGVFTNNPAAGNLTTSEIRFKQPVSGSIVTFPKLVMNGGQLDLGNGGLMIVAGEIDILTNAALYVDSGGGLNRQFRIDAQLTGGGTILWHGFANTNTETLTINGPNNTFSGQWNVDQGILIGTTTNSLGTNNIFVSANGGLETTYNIANTNGSLMVAAGGKVFLHQNDVFRTAQFGNLALQGGSNYTFATLNALFPAYFPATWTTNFGLTNVSGSGSIMVLQSVAPYVVQDMPAKVIGFSNQTVTLAPVIGGTIPLSFQWKTNGVSIPNATNVTLVLSNVAPASSGTYQLFVSDAGGQTNTVASQLLVYGFPQFTWFPPAPITTAAITLGQIGTLVGAEAWSSVTNVNTVLGGRITFMLDGSVATATGNGTGNGDYIGYAPSTGDVGFDAVLDGFSFDGGPKTVTLNGLAQDQYYSVQLFALDKRNGNGTRRAYFQDPNITTNVSKTFLMQSADYVIGTFISSGTSQVLRMQLPGDAGNGNVNNGSLNALVIRQLPRAPQIADAITISPSATVPEGTSVTLNSPPVYGPGYFTYQWRKGGNPIPGATGASLVLPAATSGNTGSYDVQATSASGYGTATATAVQLTVNTGMPFFVQQPPTTVYAYTGLPVSIPAIVGGSQPIAYQWILNGTINLPNATNQTLVLPTAQAGTYTLAATNSFGGVLSTTSQLVVPTAGSAGWIPLALSAGSLNQDVVVEATAQPALPLSTPTTATMDGGTANTGYTWYEQGFNTNLPASGLWLAGSVFTSAGDGSSGATHTFQMPPSYAANNAVMIDPAHSNATFTVGPVTGSSGLSLLATTSFGPVTNNWTVNYTDGNVDSGTFVVPDWSGGAANQAFTANGAYSPQGGTFEWFSINNPRLYQIDLFLYYGASSTISNIVLNWAGGNVQAHTAFFAASASADNINYTTHLPITGFNQDMVVEAAAGRAQRLAGVTTATFDTGVANTGNTLYEQGYNTNALVYTNSLGTTYTNALATGMPAAGSVLTTNNHVYVLAPSWIGPNAAFIDAQNSATLTLATPGPHGSLSLLTCAGNGPTTLDYTINFSDGTVQTGTLSSPDWFTKTGWVWDANGRVNIDNATFNNVGVTNANLFGVDVAVAATNQSKTITSVGLKYDSAAVGRAFVFALSAAPTLSANPDAASTLANVPVTIPALANDSDPSGYTIAIAGVSPTNGTATFSTNGVVFTPKTSFVGTAYVAYTITNTGGVSASSLITITVTAPPAPTANPDAAATFWNVPVTVQALANDSGTTGYSLYVLSVSPTNGIATISQKTNVVFTPTRGFVGLGYVGYTITNDVTGSASSLITVTVAAPPRPGVTGLAYLGSKVVLTGTNGAPNGVYVLLSSTNVALPTASWTPVLTNTFDGTGRLNVTNAVNPATPSQFFLIKQ